MLPISLASRECLQLLDLSSRRVAAPAVLCSIAMIEGIVVGFILLIVLTGPVLLGWKVWRQGKDLAQLEADHLERIRLLTRRVYALENGVELAGEPRPEPVEEAAPVAAAPMEAPSPPEPVRQPAPKPARNWEAALGGNWMNKAGVLVTVIGIALFVAYAFTLMGPGGRIALAALASLSMLAGGVKLEQNPVYRAFGRGLIGGGWAGVYVTVYAAHGIEASRIIGNPVAATALLVGVSAIMLLHSLRYRSQVVTGLAYFAAFGSLALTPLSFFAVAALAPLAASLLFVAKRFGWRVMVLFGAGSTYGLYAFQASRVEEGSLLAGQAMLLVYWLLFEGFDILAHSGRRIRGKVEAWIFPVNAFCFVTLSWEAWETLRRADVYQFFLLAAGIYLASMAARLYLSRKAEGSHFEGPLTVASAMAAGAGIARFNGPVVALLLVLQAEALYLAAARYGRRWVHALAGAAFGLATAHLLLIDYEYAGDSALQFEWWTAFSAVAVLEAALCYGNRVIGRSRMYGFLGAALLAAAVTKEFTVEHMGPAWLALAVGLFAAGAARRLPDIRWQSYAVGLIATGSLFVVNGLRFALGQQQPHWAPQLAGVLALYGLTLFVERAGGWLGRLERIAVRGVGGAAGTALLLALLRNAAPPPVVSVSWATAGLLLAFSGVLWSRGGARVLGYAAVLLAFGRSVWVDVPRIEGIEDWTAILPAAAAAGCCFGVQALTTRMGDGAALGLRARVDRTAPTVFAVLGSVLLGALLFQAVSGGGLTVAWGVQGALTLAAGFLARELRLRMIGLSALTLCTLKLFLYDLRNLETLPRILAFVVLGVLLIGASWVYTRYRKRIARTL